MASKAKSFFYIQIIFTSLVFVFSFIMFFKISFDLKRASEKTNQEIFGKSYDLVSKLKAANLANFSLPFAPSTKNEMELAVPKAAALYLGKHKIWIYPKDFELPTFNEPSDPVGEIVSISFSRKMFLTKLEDGRTAVILYQTPEYKKVWSQSIPASFLALLVGAFGIFLLIITLKRFKNSSDFSESQISIKPPENPIDSLLILKKTLAELREKNLFLEAELRKERKRTKGVSSVLENLSSALNTGFIRFDAQGNLQSFNPVAKNLIGLPILFRIGENFKKMFAKNEPFLEFIETSLEKKEIATIDAVKGLQDKLLFIISIPILDEMSHFEGVLLIIEDKSEFYSMQKIMREREALSRLGEVAAGVAHEIRNGLNVLSGELRLLRKTFPESFVERTNRIENEIGQMEKVVKDLLYYAKPIAIQKEEINSSEFFAELEQSLKELFPKTLFSFEIEIDSFFADKDSLNRAIFNIIKNGAEAAGEGGEVFVKVSKNNSFVEIHIEDSGEGLSSDIKEDIFALFTSYKKDGTGLGLPIAKKIARENGGDLTISKPIRLQGAAFDFIISL
ncbi:MAG: PAS domain-containing sensor histidine kinase [Acidobacteriota bacterium]